MPKGVFQIMTKTGSYIDVQLKYDVSKDNLNYFVMFVIDNVF